MGEGEDRRRVDTAEWFRDHAPADTAWPSSPATWASSRTTSSRRRGQVRGIDIRAKGIDETGHEKELASVEAWATLFRDIIDARPRCHIIVIGGNHDGLLCDDDLCDSRACDGSRRASLADRTEKALGPDGEKRRTPW